MQLTSAVILGCQASLRVHRPRTFDARRSIIIPKGWTPPESFTVHFCYALITASSARGNGFLVSGGGTEKKEEKK